MEIRKTSIDIYVPRIITNKEEASRYVYDWYQWPNWSSWSRRSLERKILYILAKKYSL